MYNVHDISIIHLIVPGRTGFFPKEVACVALWYYLGFSVSIFFNMKQFGFIDKSIKLDEILQN